MARSRVTALLAPLLLVPLVAACGGDEAADLPPTVPPATSSVAETSAAATPGITEAPEVEVSRTVAQNLGSVPWGVAFLPDGTALVALRDSGEVKRVTPDGRVTDAGSVPGAVHRGEGGLLGLAVPKPELTGGVPTVYAYFTADGDNRIVSMPFVDDKLGKETSILTGIPSAGNHNGGRMVFGPDDKLWVGTGESGDKPLAQDLKSLGGKILRLNLDGSVPADNPFEGSPVWTLGHRNVQGLAFDSQGRLWATEFGQNEWDELNLVERGKNYGWPEVEGDGTGGGTFVAPFTTWSTDEASPSGLAIVGDVAYVAGLRGERLWQVPLNGGAGSGENENKVARFEGEYGRLRTIVPTPDGHLWLTTSNRDNGRGDPKDGDEKILELTVG